jgi:hypothetical protein
VDEMTICLDQVSINSLLLHYKYLFMLWVSSFGGASTFKRSGQKVLNMDTDFLLDLNKLMNKREGGRCVPYERHLSLQGIG